MYKHFQLKLKLNQIGMLSLHVILPVLFVVVAIGGVGAYVINSSKAEMPTLDKAGCEIRGRNWVGSTSGNPCGRLCAPGSGNLVTASNYDYCSNTLTKANIMNQGQCTDLGRTWLLDGCARRADQLTKSNVPQCAYSYATYIVTSTNDYCNPRGVVYKTPSGAPSPTPWNQKWGVQPAAIGWGANPIVSPISDTVWNSMQGISWQSNGGCPSRSSLVMIEVNHWGFDGNRYRGKLVVNSTYQNKFINAFTQIYNSKIPLHGMYLPDIFGKTPDTYQKGADDRESMEHSNTYAFNCRYVVGKEAQKVLSPHAKGTAIDINPFENPYLANGTWLPSSWWKLNNVSPKPLYVWRSNSDRLVQIMTSAGFRWPYPTSDYQHFEAD